MPSFASKRKRWRLARRGNLNLGLDCSVPVSAVSGETGTELLSSAALEEYLGRNVKPAEFSDVFSSEVSFAVKDLGDDVGSAEDVDQIFLLQPLASISSVRASVPVAGFNA